MLHRHKVSLMVLQLYDIHSIMQQYHINMCLELQTPEVVLEQSYAWHRARYHEYSTYGFGTGYTQWLEVRQYYTILSLLGMSERAPQPVTLGGCKIRPDDVIQWLEPTKAVKTFRNQRSFYSLVARAHSALLLASSAGAHAPHTMEKELWAILQRWYASSDGKLLAPPGQHMGARTAEEEMDRQAATMPVAKVKKLITALTAMPEYATAVRKSFTCLHVCKDLTLPSSSDNKPLQ